MSAKDCVPAGGSPQESAGDMFSPVHVYFTGMAASCENALLVNSMDTDSSIASGSVIVCSGITGVDGVHADSMMAVNKM